MTKITFIAPYIEVIPTINDMIKSMNVPKSIEFEVFHAVGSSEILKMNINSDIIITRGLTYNALKKHKTDSQIIQLAVTGYDILKAVNTAVKLYKPKKIAIILAEGINVDVDFISEVFKIKVDFFTVRNEKEVEEIYTKIKETSSHDVLVTGLTVYKYALRDNFNAVKVQTGNEAIRLAIQEAITAVMATHREHRKNQLLNTIMETLEEGIIAIDSENKIYSMNDVARKMFSVFENDIIGKNAQKYIPAKVLENNATNENETVIKKINNKNMVIKYRPLVVDGFDEGLIINIAYVDSLQKTEIDIRKKLNQKGLTAKYNFSNIIGDSDIMVKTVNIAKKYAQTESDVLIIGETGTGKELFAQSIHNYSKRAKEPFVALNCAAINENLLESELFGYTEGAFTGAVKGGKTGLFELAHRGTLFMDEIGELPLSLQAKLLRVLQEKEIRKLGDDRIIPVDVRIIAATNVNLRKLAEDGAFRQDLLYRLDILNITIPPLRMRKDDIEKLAQNFISKYDFNGMPIVLENGAAEILTAYNWKGNIRELRNICERLCVLNGTGIITKYDVKDVFENSYYTEDFSPNLDFEQIKNQFAAKKMTMDQMAKSMGISRTTLWRRMKNNETKK